MSAWTCPLWQCHSGAAGRRESRRDRDGNGDGDDGGASSRRHRCFLKGRALHIVGVPAVARDPATCPGKQSLRADRPDSSQRSGGCRQPHDPKPLPCPPNLKASRHHLGTHPITHHHTLHFLAYMEIHLSTCAHVFWQSPVKVKGNRWFLGQLS